jgi:hypothetical protein
MCFPVRLREAYLKAFGRDEFTASLFYIMRHGTISIHILIPQSERRKCATARVSRPSFGRQGALPNAPVVTIAGAYGALAVKQFDIYNINSECGDLGRTNIT